MIFPNFLRVLLASLLAVTPFAACKKPEPSKAIYNPPPEVADRPVKKDRKKLEKEAKEKARGAAKRKESTRGTSSPPASTAAPAATKSR